MKIFKKIAAAFTAAVIAVSACASMALTAAADSIYDTAKEIKSGQKVNSIYIGIGENADYKVNVSESGRLTVDFYAGWKYCWLYLYDSNGNVVSNSDWQMNSGYINSWGEDGLEFEWNEATEKINATVFYSVKKGTYYLRAYRSRYDGKGGDGKLTLTATYPSATTSKAKISYITINLEKGDTLSLGAALSGGSGTVKWSSSKPSVATVSSKGKVTAKKSGSTIITAKVGSSYKKVKITVS